MPGFREHITGSTIVGVTYGVAAWYAGGVPPLTCTLAAGLCAASGLICLPADADYLPAGAMVEFQPFCQN